MKHNKLQKIILEVLKEDKWMQKAFDPKKKGALHKQLGVPEDKPIPLSKIDSELSTLHSKVEKGQKLSKNELTKQRRLQAAKNAKKANEIVEDEIPGGKGDNAIPQDFDPEQLKMGIKVEREHTDDPEKAQEIAMDHLTEDPEYYSKLKSAGLADELEESIRKKIRNIIAEYYADEQATKFVDAVVDLLHNVKGALSTDIEKAAQIYYSKYYRSAKELTFQLQSISNFIKKLTSLK